MARTPKSYKTKDGRRWRIGYRDEQGVERTRGGFLRQSHASGWYYRLEQARSKGRLKTFLDEDAGLSRSRWRRSTISWLTGSGWMRRRSSPLPRRSPTSTSITSICGRWPATGR